MGKYVMYSSPLILLTLNSAATLLNTKRVRKSKEGSRREEYLRINILLRKKL